MLKSTLKAIVVALLVLLPLGAFAQATALTISAPSEAKGDGVTPIQVQVNLDSGKPGELDGMQVELSAGRVSGRKELGAGVVEIAVVPPRTAEDAILTVVVQTRGGKSAKSQIRLLATISNGEMRTSRGPLDVRVPARMILGYEKQATVSFRASSGAGISLYASAGTISAPRQDVGGRFSSVYMPPAQKLPRVVLIVAANSDGSIVDYVPIQLYGHPIISTLSEPNATVLMRVSGEEFGPFQADRQGRVGLRVLVPPGVTQAQTVAQDAFHNERTVTLELGVSTVREAFAICPPASETLFYFAVDAEGAVRGGLDIRVDSTLGESAPAQLVEGRYYAAPLIMPTDAALGHPVTLTAQIEREPESRVTCETSVAGEAPSRLQLNATPDTWIAGSKGPVRVHIHATYEGTRTPRSVAMLASTDFGELSPIEALGLGESTATWNIPSKLGGRRSAKVQVQTVGQRPVRAELTIPLRAGPAALARVSAQPASLKADGRSRAQLRVEVFDANGNPVDATPEVINVQGTISRFSRTSAGVFSATYRAPRSSLLLQDDVSVRVRGTNAITSARINLTPTVDRLRFWGALGYSTNFAKVRGFSGSVGGGTRLPILREHLRVGAELGYVASRVTELDAAGLDAVTIKTTVVPVLARATYEVRVFNLTPYVGFAGGVGMVRTDVSSASSGRFAQWRGRPALAAMVGGSWRWRYGSTLAEVMYRSISLSEPAVSGNAGGLSFMAGYLYAF